MENNTILDSELEVEISGYTRISVDIEKDSDENVSIENQIKIITDYVKKHFPKCTLTIYKDRDRSGYSFDKREDYQRMRPRLMSGKSKILIIKDFSRFARRNSLGLWELEQIRDAGVRIISIMDSIDYPKNDDWLMIQFRFLTNELPVTDASKKVRRVIDNKQQNGEWLCAVPYGYQITNQKKLQFEVVPDEAQIIKEIFKLYNEDGWGYKKIANHLTEKNIPTPRTKEKERAEARGDTYKRKHNTAWSHVTIQGILGNDFYIGTLRQHKYTRKKINGEDVKLDKEEHTVFQKHHKSIVDDKTFAYTQELLKQRTRANYRGVKKYDTSYSGYLFCGDCNSPMFSMSRKDLAPAYTCGTYHKRGLNGCTAHHTRVDFLDGVLKDYVKMLRLNCKEMIEQLEKAIAVESVSVKENDKTLALLENQLFVAKEELKATKKRKIKDIAKNPDDEELIEETYAEMERELSDRIYGLQEQIKMCIEKRNDIVEVNRAAKTVFSVFDDILKKEKLDKYDIGLLVEKITVFDNGNIDIQLRADVEELLKTGTLPREEETVNFKFDSIGISYNTQYTHKSQNQRDKAYTVNVICEGDPLEIYTDREGEVIFKKYSPIGELSGFAAQYAETLHKTCDMAVIICDRDAIIACAGLNKKDYAEKPFSDELEDIIETRTFYHYTDGGERLPVTDDEASSNYVSCAMPIISQGDIIGCVASVVTDSNDRLDPAIESKLIQTAATFLGKQLDS